MGESKRKERQTYRHHHAEETNLVGRSPKKDCRGATSTVGEGEGRKEERLTSSRGRDLDAWT
jgi:hypothetical protein